MITPAFMTRNSIALLVCFIVAASCPDTSFAVQDIASFTSVTGEVRIKSSVRAKGKWLRVKKVGVTLFNGDEIRTLAGKAEITFDDGSIMKVDENTSLKIEERPTKRKLFGFIDMSFMNRNIKVSFGKLWANIKKARGKWTSFESKVAVAGIKGTSVSMYVDSKGDMQFACHEGLVAITKTDGSYELTMDKGKEVWIKSKDQDRTLIQSVKGELDIESRNGAIDLEDKGSVLIGESAEGTFIAVPASNEGVVTVSTDSLTASLDSGDEIVISVEDMTGREVTTIRDISGPVEVEVGDIQAMLDAGEVIAATFNPTQWTLTLCVERGHVDVIREGQATVMSEGDCRTETAIKTRTEPEAVSEPEPIVVPLPVEKDCGSSAYIPGSC